MAYNNNGNNGYQGNRNNNNYGNNNNGSYQKKPYGNNNGGGWKGNNSGGGGNWKGRQQEEDFDEASFRIYKPYAFASNKNTPQAVLDTMVRLAKELEQHDYTSRSDGSEGLGDAIEKAATNNEMYLPWNGFNDKQSKFYFNDKPSMAAAKMFHPAFDGLSNAIKAFLARNARMVLGQKLNSPASFIICWSEDGAESSQEVTSKTGTVGHVISLASARKIPVFNFSKNDAEQRLKAYLALESQPNQSAKSEEQQDEDFF